MIINTLLTGSTGNSTIVLLGDDPATDPFLIIDLGLSMKRMKREVIRAGMFEETDATAPTVLKQLFSDRCLGILLTHLHGDHLHKCWVNKGFFGVKAYALPWNIEECDCDKTREALTPFKWKSLGLPTMNRNEVSSVNPKDEVMYRSTTSEVNIWPRMVDHDFEGSAAWRIFHEGVKECPILQQYDLDADWRQVTPDQAYVHVTDLGCVNSDLLELVEGCDTLALEFNYDHSRIDLGREERGNHWADRVESSDGHLSNQDAAALVEYCKPRKVVVLHRSGLCNSKELVLASLAEVGYDGEVVVGEQDRQTGWVGVGATNAE